jgi:hypothetical protein
MSVGDSKDLIKILSLWVSNYCKSNNISKIFYILDSSPSSIVLQLICSDLLSGLSAEGIPFSLGEEQNALNLFILAKNNNGVVASYLDYTYSKYCRVYNKAVVSLMDIFPIKGLLYSEVLQLANISDGLDFVMQEWAINIEQRSNIITSNELPNKNVLWPTLTINQKKFIAELHAREKRTRHKEIVGKPFCDVSDLRILCREEYPKKLL